jgi:cell division protein FtsW (lipid II flippase)
MDARRASIRARVRFFALFSLLSLGTVLIGCAIASANDVSAGSWGRNLVAWLVGALIAALFAIQRSNGFLRGLVVAAPVGLAATLLNAGREGVRRWIDVGPIHANLAAILLPGGIVALAALSARERWTWLIAALVGVLLVLQPDASQATAFGAGVVVILMRIPAPRATRAACIAAVLALIVTAWLRPDPLGPVAEVEGIIGLAARWSPLAALLAVAVLASVVLSPLLVGNVEDAPLRTASSVLATYLALSALTPLVGTFPVPLVGIGMSPIIGFWLGCGSLIAVSGGSGRFASTREESRRVGARPPRSGRDN